MARLTACVILAFVSIVYFNNEGEYSVLASKFSWMEKDKFDEINDHISSIDETNCRNKDKANLQLRKDVVSQLPVYNELLSRVWYRNRSSLIHIHNMALNRAFFYSYVLQKMNDSASFYKQPNWMYFYFSATADVHANPDVINGSAFYFDNNCHYPNWYTTVPFNNTIPLFGPRVWRHDDYGDQGNFLREPTRTTAKGVDAGAGRFMNYTHRSFKMNPWYENWLPDITGDMDSMTKFTYYIGIKESNVTGQFTTDTFENYAFFGPNSPSASDRDERLLPVQFTAPYFDCGGSNKWVVSAVSPVVDFMPRYTNWTHLRRQRIVGVTVTDIDFMEIDFNACGVSNGNPGPNYMAGVHRCRATTGCKHAEGFGFRRGGYNCVCGAGNKWPNFLVRPYRGTNIEQATMDEYFGGFQCTPSDYRLVLPIVDSEGTVTVEGAGVVVNSGGLVSEELGRRRRDTHSNSTVLRYEPMEVHTLHNVSKKDERKSKPEAEQTPKEEYREPSLQEIMALADRIRNMRESNKLHKYLKKQGSQYKLDEEEMAKDDVHRDYIERNNVDYTVEKEYEDDLKQHEEYRDFLIEADIASGKPNVSRVQQLLQEDVDQMRERHEQRYHANRFSANAKRRTKRESVYDHQAFERMMEIVRWKESISSTNCGSQPEDRLILPGGVGYGADAQFDKEGRTALRLSNFLSMYLQNVMPDENFGNLRGGGPLHKDMMFGEVLANVMGNYRIASAGVFFDRYKFENDDGSVREMFGPWAFRKNGAYYALDQAGYTTSYLDTDWFMQAKARHGANFNGIQTYRLRGYVRSDPNGTSIVRHEFFPITYRAAPYEVGFWSKPYFRCDGNVDEWVMRYTSPFFGMDSLRTRLEFRGVTTVEVPLRYLEINQCPMEFDVPNAFKNTARCDYFSTFCRPMPGFPFMRGSYRCNCRVGFEYWHADGKSWFEGSLVELEYEKKVQGYFSRFDHLYCRRAGASSLVTSIWMTITAVVAALGLVASGGH